MRLEYSSKSDVAYIYFEEPPFEVKYTITLDPRQTDAMINLDFDHQDRLVSIEVIEASLVLPRGMLPPE